MLRPTPKLEDHPLSAVLDFFFQFICSYPPYRRPFLRLQPEDAPSHGDRDPQTRSGASLVWLIKICSDEDCSEEYR